MASNSTHSLLLLAAVLLVSIFAAATATGDYCYAGMGIPASPLPSCREYVAQQTCGADIVGPPSVPISKMRYQCCLELSQIDRHCRCQALAYFSARESTPGGIKELPGCPWEPQRDFARILVTPGQCNLDTKYLTRYCLAWEL